MARDAECTRILSELRSLFPSRWLEATAREVGWLQRRRRITPVAMFWTLVLGFGCGKERTLASLRRTYELETGDSLVPSSFYDRFTRPLVEFLRQAVARGCEQLCQRAAEGAVGEARARFDDIMGIDSTVLRLHDALSRHFPGTRTNHSPAAAKLHLVCSVLGRGPRSVKLTDERTHDARVRHLGAWVRGKLLLFDLGYYSFRAFSSIRRHGGSFITRLKDGANPELREIVEGTPTTVVQPGARLRDVLARTRRDVLDVTAELRFRKRTYRGVARAGRETFRIVAIRDATTRKFHVYVTDIDAEHLAADEIAAAYAARWTLELIFKELKSTYRLHQLPSTNRHVVEALILASVLTLIVSRALLAALARGLRAELRSRLRPLRWARVFTLHAASLQALLLDPRQFSQRWKERWTRLLRHQAVDPNVTRDGLGDLARALQVS